MVAASYVPPARGPLNLTGVLTPAQLRVGVIFSTRPATDVPAGLTFNRASAIAQTVGVPDLWDGALGASSIIDQ